MFLRVSFIASLAIVVGQANGADDSWILHGRILDERGRPVASAAVTTVWSANGITLERVRQFEKERGDSSDFARNEGRMEPLGHAPTQTDVDGRFSMNMEWRNYFVLAIDKERKHGALILVDPNHVPSRVEAKLVPLVRLAGRVRLSSTGKAPEETTVVAHVPEKEDFPLGFPRLAMCSSLKGQFEFLLPPGDYLLEVSTEVSHRHYELDPLRRVKLAAGQREVDAGILEASPSPPTMLDRINEAKTKGNWIEVDRKKLYGKPAPKWYAVDARGIPKDAQVSAFKGKWVLVYFWGPRCSPCLGKHLPDLTRLYEIHERQRDRFEIVAVCVEPSSGLKTIAELDRELKPVVKAVWHGKELPFPVVLDNTLKTVESFGVDALGRMLLIDPQGRLVPGDETTLLEKLGQAKPADQKP